jgi:hypothetical protein
MSKDIRIVILQRGWIVVGVYSQVGNKCYIENGYNIERWGTTEGLGELAYKGKLPETRLRKLPKLEYNELTEVLNIKCNNCEWEKLCQ